MTTLPAIKRKGTAGSNKDRTSSLSTKNMRFMTWKDRELLKQQNIRDEKPTMTKVETATYRNSYKHNLCIAMLKDGFHKSFDELFSLIEMRKAEREESGPDSVLWQERSLEEQEEKLDQIWLYLTKAESSLRAGKWEEVYMCRHKLAEYFLESEDRWLSDHFYKTALESSLNIRLDGHRREAEARCNMGLSHERNGDLKAAADEMEKAHHLSLGRMWMAGAASTLHKVVCRHLSRMYTTLAERSSTVIDAQKLLHRSYDMSKEGEDPLQEATAALRLGRNYELAKDSETAIEHLGRCLEGAQDLGDSELIGEVCEALAKSHQTQGNVGRSIECLELFAETSRTNNHKRKLVDACNCLGVVYNTLGHYDKAVNHFDSAYGVATELQQDVEESGVQLGIAKGNQLLNAFKQNMEIPSRFMLDRISIWKDERANEFGQPLPTKYETPPKTPEKIPDPTEPFREVERMQT
uniref:Tetratricopeptide repeat protein 29 n=1 Tax=Phallusia mammillata TaxID=59560 RepID=A0A6F9DWT7_9ASCI|nr:tetratricopeptide repeat protein 29-like [Phallusia mammillata]